MWDNDLVFLLRFSAPLTLIGQEYYCPPPPQGEAAYYGTAAEGGGPSA